MSQSIYKILFSVLLVGLSISCQSQSIDIDKFTQELEIIENDYNRKYRTELNKSDTILINSLVNEINQNCEKFDSIFHSRLYSNAFIKELSSKLVINSICLDVIVKNSTKTLSGYHLRGRSNYPIYDMLISDHHNLICFSDFLISSNITKSDSFLFESSRLNKEVFIDIISKAIEQYDRSLDSAEIHECNKIKQSIIEKSQDDQ
jgi:hypothetical protein